MTSQINPNNIDGSYPVAGVPNNTQGFRDNFTNTKTNFQYAADEITELQTKAVLKSALDGTLLDNNMDYNLLSYAQLKSNSFTEVILTQTSGSVNLDFSAGSFQAIPASTGPVSLSFSNWPAAGQVGVIRFAFVCTNSSHTLTFPNNVLVGVEGLQGVSPGTAGVSNTITFAQTRPYYNVYIYEFSTSNGGTQCAVQELTRPRDVFDSTIRAIANVRSTSSTTGSIIIDGVGGIGVAGNVHAGGNVYGTYLVGDGGYLSNVTVASNVAVTQIANGTSVMAVNGSGGNITMTVGGVANVGVWTATGLSLNGNITGNANVSGEVYSAGNINVAPGSYLLGDGSLLSNIYSNYVFFGNSYMGFGTNNGNGNISVNGTSNLVVFTPTAAIFSGDCLVSAVGNVQAGNVLAGTISLSGNVLSNIVSSNKILTSSNSGIGYTVGAGGTQTQTANKSNPVTLNAVTGEITMNNQNLSAGATATFVLNNTAIANTDVMIINVVGGATAGAYTVNSICNTANATIQLTNHTAGALAEAVVLRYAVIKAATS